MDKRPPSTSGLIGKDQSAERQAAMTELEFGRYAARIASKASAWAVEIVEMEDWRLKGELTGTGLADAHSVARFTDEIRRLIDHMDRKVGRLSDEPQSSDDTFPRKGESPDGGHSHV